MKHLMLLIWAMLAGGCAVSIDGDKYQQQSPEFSLTQFFDGEVKAWGIVQNRSGELVQRFEVVISGTVNGDTLTLDETFTYSLGSGPEKRIWTIENVAPGSFTGSAGDIAGPATGTSYGNALRWQYEMDLPVGDTEYRVTFDDWIWAFDDQTIVNRSYIKKFGVVAAEVTLFMQKQ